MLTTEIGEADRKPHRIFSSLGPAQAMPSKALRVHAALATNTEQRKHRLRDSVTACRTVIGQSRAYKVSVRTRECAPARVVIDFVVRHAHRCARRLNSPLLQPVISKVMGKN
ncbi:hypothetical protein EGR_08629 [Echinococcus granulosus]|uniref:Uncharacterized protein n=1 Tax=Echinococcus granulosus TaxID=6210 RepID=W6UEJ8_ECHGR|nr:hypothetical protein EGR_08629 [Echinococcus granulosus]EUB56507.1 hypothetical protein EGR_08629 [Echinococcus granulosus]